MTNILLLAGRLASDPIEGTSQNGPWIRLRMITPAGYTDKQTNEWVDTSVGHDLMISARREGLYRYVQRNAQKGRWIEVQAALNYREYVREGQGTGIHVAAIQVERLRFPIGDRKDDGLGNRSDHGGRGGDGEGWNDGGGDGWGEGEGEGGWDQPNDGYQQGQQQRQQGSSRGNAGQAPNSSSGRNGGPQQGRQGGGVPGRDNRSGQRR